MFDIGFLELVVVGIVALLVLGPERLPGAIRTGTRWLTKIRRTFQHIKLEIEQELNADELKRQLHNDAIMDTLKNTRSDIENNLQDARNKLQQELGDSSYDMSDVFPQQQQDTLPDHEPLPDIYGDPEESTPPRNKP